MLGKHDAGLDDVEVVQLRLVGFGERTGEKIGLLLVVALQTHPVAWPDDGFHEPGRVFQSNDFAFGEALPGLKPFFAISLLRVPINHA